MSDAPISHGRGGAANITKDTAPYADGEIVREGPVGDQGDGAYSAGRGGQGNIASPKVHPSKNAKPGDADVVPETALRSGTPEHFHVGRGGEGNEVHQHAERPHQGLADKLKDKLFHRKEEK